MLKAARLPFLMVVIDKCIYISYFQKGLDLNRDRDVRATSSFKEFTYWNYDKVTTFFLFVP